MDSHVFSGSFVPMSLLTLSFTKVQSLYFDLSLKTRQKSATFRCEANFAPLSKALPLTFAFSGILYPLGGSVSLAVDLLGLFDLTQEPVGFSVFRMCDLRRVRVPSILRQEFYSFVIENPYFNNLPACLLAWRISSFRPKFSFHGAYDDSLALTLTLLSLAEYIKLAVRISAFVPCIPLISLLTILVGGVLDPFTWEYREGVL
ncbi:hypothetical protein MiSe_36220 [Microseira wollei NIES-4236]|uniref:Uncharacterized protein n=1 Tax=Microseira wollei NIES-4236 TaxID=2530354 RepID=A0AAV3XBS4_9CYAN|nr:hypothetical protein MiSe_36220 [Microseira wollei NIES-4236]